MKLISCALLAWFSIISCPTEKQKQPKHQQQKLIKKKNGIGITDTISVYEIKPTISIATGNDSAYNLGQFYIRCDTTHEHTILTINSREYDLRKFATINELIYEGASDTLDWTHWLDSIHVYKFKSRFFICTTLQFFPCNGIGCGVRYYLIYDSKTKNISAFGSYRYYGRFGFYDSNRDNLPEILALTRYGDLNGACEGWKYSWYQLNQNDNFTLNHYYYDTLNYPARHGY